MPRPVAVGDRRVVADGRLALYVALELPPIIESAVLLVGSILQNEFGCRNALRHRPHVTLHPPFFPSVETEEIVRRLELAAAAFPDGRVEVQKVESFDSVQGEASQVVLRFAPSWCRPAHELLLERLSPCWDISDPLTAALWPREHRGSGFTPHVTLAVGDLPPEVEGRRALKLRATVATDEILAIARAPSSFAPTRLHLVQYEQDWSTPGAPPSAGPDVVATISLVSPPAVNEREPS